jgi:flagellar M-ring protein FliF
VSSPAKTLQLPGPVAGAIAKGRTLLGGLSRSLRILLATTIGSAALLLAFLGYQHTHEPYALLFSQLDQDDGAAIVGKLKELKIPFQVGGGGSTIEVPESRVGEIRLQLASAGMPRGGVGFESFDKMRLGATEFEQRVLYRRALEGELSRTITTLGAVQSARVHLVLPEKSVFVSRADPATASIVLKLRAGRTLGASEVSGIIHLVAASVPGLSADQVALVTTDGEMLKKPRNRSDGAGGLDAEEEQGALQRTVESQLENQARSMLERVVGPGHVDVRVTAEIDPARVEHTEDHYDPARTALRSEESSVERSGTGIDDSVAGVPGAESNLPGGAAPSATTNSLLSAAAPKTGDAGAPKATSTANGRAGEPFRESHTRNFEVDHVSDKRVVRSGTVKRITAAVVLDGTMRIEDGKRIMVARDKLELERLTALVRSAMGASDARGDVVTVDSVPFLDGAAVIDAPAPPPPPLSPVLTWAKPFRKYLPALALACALLVGGGMWSVVARRRQRQAAKPTELELPPPAVAEVRIEPTTTPEALRAAALERAARDPATAALVVRFWLGTAETEGTNASRAMTA